VFLFHVLTNPICTAAMQTLWMATCQVFVAELSRLRRHRHPVQLEAERALVDAIDTVLAVMNVFAPQCRLMGACAPLCATLNC
jgi:hypothetical protein